MRFSLSLTLAFAVVPQETFAVDGKDAGTWQNRIAVYLWMAGLDGTSGNRMEAGEIEASFSDIMENFDAGFMLDYRGKKDKWGMGLDLIYLNINPNPSISGPNPASLGPPIITADGDVNVKQWIVDFTGRYEIMPDLELLAGGRYVDLDIDAKVNLPGPQQNQLKVSGQESWIDPIVRSWRLAFRADISRVLSPRAVCTTINGASGDNMPRLISRTSP